MSNDVFHGIRAASAVDALGIAAANGKLREMNLLLQDGIAIDARATYSGRNPLQSAALQGQTRALEILLAAGAEVNATDVDEMTALMNACHVGKVKGSKAALQLIAAGADVRFIRRADSMTALKFAVQDCTPEVIQTLIDRGAEVDGPADTKQTALMIAARANNVEAIRVLVKNGADLSLRCGIPWADGRTAEGLAELEKKKAALGALREARQAASNKA